MRSAISGAQEQKIGGDLFAAARTKIRFLERVYSILY